MIADGDSLVIVVLIVSLGFVAGFGLCSQQNRIQELEKEKLAIEQKLQAKEAGKRSYDEAMERMEHRLKEIELYYMKPESERNYRR